ncbi:hypothetical protein BJ878DRAFT_287239 [Calycina marina]|uniref:Uncharacterized protein n=1 Tax=Calycina marina TaxID=1763456 RepID=A0A9P8CJA5_9HELO|nr:hypothetical protein BJ878DRAFT_287239 [Calycina marina]
MTLRKLRKLRKLFKPSYTFHPFQALHGASKLSKRTSRTSLPANSDPTLFGVYVSFLRLIVIISTLQRSYLACSCYMGTYILPIVTPQHRYHHNYHLFQRGTIPTSLLSGSVVSVSLLSSSSSLVPYRPSPLASSHTLQRSIFFHRSAFKPPLVPRGPAVVSHGQ